MTTDNDAHRRAYWTQQYDAADKLIKQVLTCQFDECGEGFVSLIDAAREAGVQVIFSETKVVGDLDRLFHLRSGLIDMYLAAAEVMNRRGWVMKIEDGFRTRAIQTGLGTRPDIFDAVLDRIVWECGGDKPPVDLVFRRVSCLIATYPITGTHMSGSAIDISVFERSPDGAIGPEIDRGGPYVEMSELTPMTSPFVSAEAQRNRRQITEVMEAEGFIAYPYEFWHYNAGDVMAHLRQNNDAPARYGPVDWDPQTNEVTSIENVLDPLIPTDVMQLAIDDAMARLDGPA